MRCCRNVLKILCCLGHITSNAETGCHLKIDVDEANIKVMKCEITTCSGRDRNPFVLLFLKQLPFEVALREGLALVSFIQISLSLAKRPPWHLNYLSVLTAKFLFLFIFCPTAVQMNYRKRERKI